MRVKVELQAYLEQYSPNGQDTFDYEIPDGARVKDLVVKLGMPEELASVIIVGNTNADPSHSLKEGDRVTLIPPLAGGAAEPSRLKRNFVRFGKVAAWLAGALIRCSS